MDSLPEYIVQFREGRKNLVNQMTQAIAHVKQEAEAEKADLVRKLAGSHQSNQNVDETGSESLHDSPTIVHQKEENHHDIYSIDSSFCHHCSSDIIQL